MPQTGDLQDSDQPGARVAWGSKSRSVRAGLGLAAIAVFVAAAGLVIRTRAEFVIPSDLSRWRDCSPDRQSAIARALRKGDRLIGLGREEILRTLGSPDSVELTYDLSDGAARYDRYGWSLLVQFPDGPSSASHVTEMGTREQGELEPFTLEAYRQADSKRRKAMLRFLARRHRLAMEALGNRAVSAAEVSTLSADEQPDPLLIGLCRDAIVGLLGTPSVEYLSYR